MPKWYTRIGDLTPEEWEAEQKRIDEQERNVSQTFLFFAFPILMMVIPFTSPIATSLLGIWLVIGSGNFWWRIALTMVAVFVMGCWSPIFAALILWALFVSTSLSYGMSLIVSRLHLMPSRTLQFSIWQLGGCTIIMAASLALLRGVGFSLKEFAEMESQKHFFLLDTLIVLNVVVASIPVFVPDRYRKVRLFGLSAILVLLVLPSMEIALITPLTGWRPSPLGGLALLTYTLHILGLLVVWLFALNMDRARGFCDVEPPAYNGMEVDQPDPLGPPTLSDVDHRDEGTQAHA